MSYRLPLNDSIQIKPETRKKINRALFEESYSILQQQHEREGSEDLQELQEDGRRVQGQLKEGRCTAGL